MKTLLKNKKMISGLVATTLGVAILVMSLSVAWFSSGGSSTTSITLGQLSVDGQLYSLGDDVDQNYPGTNWYEGRAGWLQKGGNLSAFTQLDLTVFVRQNPGYGTWEGYANDWLTVIEDGITDMVHPLGTWIGIGDAVRYIWFTGHDGKYYVEMDGNDRLHFAYDLEIPTWLKNDFQAAAVSVNFNWDAVQARPDPEAIVDYFNIPDLVIADLEFDIGGFKFIAPGPAILGTTNAAGVNEPFFKIIDNLVMYPPVNGLNANGDGTTFSTFSSGPSALEALADYVQSLEDGWLKYSLCEAYGIAP